MATQKQVDAARANSARSTGPRTREGKAASSRNALKHGMRSRSVVIDGEDHALYDKLYADLCDQYVSLTIDQAFAIRQMVDARWRLDRLKAYESTLFEADEIDTAELDRNSRWQVRLENSYYRALKALERLQPVRRAVPSPEEQPPSNGKCPPQKPEPYVLLWTDPETGESAPAPGFDWDGPLPPDRRDRG